jgi:transcriptional regulator with XRE-family HTH domain
MSEDADPSGAPPGAEVRRRSRLPGFDEIAARRDLWSTLAAHRRAVGVSQDAIARRMGTTQSSIARLEAGGTDARLSTLQRYAAALDAGLSVGFAADGRVGVEVRPTRPDDEGGRP